MNCLVLRGEQSFTIDTTGGASYNLPVRMQVRIPGSAQCLVVSPGLFDNSGTASNPTVSIAIYRGNGGVDANDWTDAPIPFSNPVHDQIALFQGFVVWAAAPLDFVVEVNVAGGGSFPSNSKFRFTIQAFDESA